MTSDFLDALKRRLSYGKRGAILGKLSFKEEAAEKLRIFALVDSFTQTLLKPLHICLYLILDKLPNDGTYSHDKSVQRSLSKMVARGQSYSYDLSSATDRLPISLQSCLISEIFNCHRLGPLWASLLVDRDYMIQKNSYGIPEGPIRYTVGQPMGALSS